jgi:hypothetical protein
MSSSYSVEHGELWVQNDTSVASDDVIIQGLMIMLGCIYLLQCICCCSRSVYAFCFLIHLLGGFSRSRTRCYCCGSSFLYDIDRVQEEVCLEKRPRSIVEELYKSTPLRSHLCDSSPFTALLASTASAGSFLPSFKYTISPSPFPGLTSHSQPYYTVAP